MNRIFWFRRLFQRPDILLICLTGSLIVLSALIQWTYSTRRQAWPQAENGVLDLAGWDFASRGVIGLSGQWEIYQQQLLTPADFVAGSQAAVPSAPAISPRLDGYQPVPARWSWQALLTAGNQPTYATYRLQITGLTPGGVFGFKKTNIRRASAIYANGRLLLKDGQPVARINLEQTGNSPQISFLKLTEPQLEILVQVASDTSLQAGIAEPIFFGTEQDILQLNNSRFIRELTSQTILVTIGLVYIFLFLVTHRLRLDEKMNVSFAIFCFCLAFISSLMGERTFLLLWPAATYRFVMHLLYLSIVVCTASMAVFLHRSDPAFLPRRHLTWQLSALGLCLGLFLILPQTMHFLIMAILVVLASLYNPYLLLRNLRRYWHGQHGGLEPVHHAILIYILIALIIYNLDMTLYSYGVISYRLLGGLSSAALGLALIILLGIQFHSAKVRQLRSSYRLILQAKESKNVENAFLRAQINPHFLFNTLNTIKSYCYTDGQKATELLVNLRTYLQNNYATDRFNQLIPLARELSLIDAYLKIEKARFGERLNTVIDVPAELLATLLPAASIQPLVENAIRHGLMPGEEGGTVWISARQVNEDVLIIVADNGIGLTEEQVARLLAEPAIAHSQAPPLKSGPGVVSRIRKNRGTDGQAWAKVGCPVPDLFADQMDSGVRAGHRPGEMPHSSENQQRRGVGLQNVNKRLVNAFGQGLQISSQPGQGSSLSFTVPANSSRSTSIPHQIHHANAVNSQPGGPHQTYHANAVPAPQTFAGLEKERQT